MPSRTNPPPLGMHPTDEHLAWHRLNFGPESDAQVQLSRMPTDWTPDAEHNPEEWEPAWTSTEWSPGRMPTAWAPDCEHIPEEWEPDWTSSEWEPPWESWASDAECSPPEREPVCPSTQGQPAVGPSTNDSPLPNSWGPGVDRRTPNFTADGRRVKRPRGGASERSHNGYYRRPSGA